MSKMSQLCSLTTKYTNHNIRATGATLLSRCMFNPAQIMAVTGHKSVSSLAVHQRVSDSEKIAMGKAICCVDNNNSALLKAPFPTSKDTKTSVLIRRSLKVSPALIFLMVIYKASVTVKSII